jgi:hypothetical protein
VEKNLGNCGEVVRLFDSELTSCKLGSQGVFGLSCGALASAGHSRRHARDGQHYFWVACRKPLGRGYMLTLRGEDVGIVIFC